MTQIENGPEESARIVMRGIVSSESDYEVPTSPNELNKLIEDVQELAYRIKTIDTLILSIENTELKQQYSQDLMNLISGYRRLVTFLESELKAYSKLEKEQNLPINIKFRRVLKHLKQLRARK